MCSSNSMSSKAIVVTVRRLVSGIGEISASRDYYVPGIPAIEEIREHMVGMAGQGVH